MYREDMAVLHPSRTWACASTIIGKAICYFFMMMEVSCAAAACLPACFQLPWWSGGWWKEWSVTWAAPYYAISTLDAVVPCLVPHLYDDAEVTALML